MTGASCTATLGCSTRTATTSWRARKISTRSAMPWRSAPLTRPSSTSSATANPRCSTRCALDSLLRWRTLVGPWNVSLAGAGADVKLKLLCCMCGAMRPRWCTPVPLSMFADCTALAADTWGALIKKPRRVAGLQTSATPNVQHKHMLMGFWVVPGTVRGGGSPADGHI